MFLLLTGWFRSRRYVWSPAVDLADPKIFSALLPGTHA
jgi:hypothetical protein